MDAFFASVEERDKPRLRGRPIVVGSDPAGGKGRGVVSTANYAARAYGIKSAMPISRAWDKSQQAKKAGKPEVVFMEPDMRAYMKASSAIMEHLALLGDAFESPGADEAYLELRGKSSQQAEQLAQEIQAWVRDEQKLSCSIGIGPNKLIAKIAANRKKPNGLTMVPESRVQDFLDPLSVRELWGVGPKTESALNERGIHTIKELRQKTKEWLIEEFGKHGAGMYLASRGVDDSPLESSREAKSIGEQITFEKDTLDAPTILAAFKKMATSVALQLKKQNFFFKTIAIVVRFADFDTKTRSHTLNVSTNDPKVLESEALKMFLPFLDSRENPKRKLIRLVGVRAENLETKLF